MKVATLESNVLKLIELKGFNYVHDYVLKRYLTATSNVELERLLVIAQILLITTTEGTVAYTKAAELENSISAEMGASNA